MDALGESGTPRSNLIHACELFSQDPTSEFGRVLATLSVDIVGALRATPKEWRVHEHSDNLSEIARLQIMHFLRDIEAPEISSGGLVHLLLRNNASALTQVHLAVRGSQRLPTLISLYSVCATAVDMTRQAVSSWGLEVAPTVSAPPMSDAQLVRIHNSPFGNRLVRRMEGLAADLRNPRRRRPLTSLSVLRAALALGSDQRLATWIRATSISPIGFVRSDLESTELESQQKTGCRIGDVVLTRTAAAALMTAQHLAELSGQQLNADRLIIGSLLTSGSYVELILRSIFGPGVNLPLLYLRSARPSALTPGECRYLVALGDRLASSFAHPHVGDVSQQRYANIRLEAMTRHSPYEALTRCELFLDRAATLPLSFDQVVDPVERGLRTGGMRYFALAAAAAKPGSHSAPAEALKFAIDGIAESTQNTDPISLGAASVLGDLTSDSASDRCTARRRLAALQTGEIDLRVLGAVSPTPGDESLAAAAAGDARLLCDWVRLHLGLRHGREVVLTRRPRTNVAVCIGGCMPNFAVGVVGDDETATWPVELSERTLLSLWQMVRSAALHSTSIELRSTLRTFAGALQLDAYAQQFRNANIDLYVVPPFDALYIELAIRTISQPASVTLRILGDGFGGWSRSLRALGLSGGRRVFVADPSATLGGAQIEARWLASDLNGEVVAGVDADRAHVLRAFEADGERPQLFHFTGHGMSGFQDPDGSLVSGVVVGEGDVLTAAAIANSAVPRVVVASACDVACLPPLSRARGWHTSIIAAGVAWSIAPSLPVNDAGAVAFSMLLYSLWRESDHIERAFALTGALGREPLRVRVQLRDRIDNPRAREVCISWLEGSSSSEIELLFSSFGIATA